MTKTSSSHPVPDWKVTAFQQASPRTPILVGVGQCMRRSQEENGQITGPTPLQLMVESAQAAIADAADTTKYADGPYNQCLNAIDAVCAVRLAGDTIANGQDRYNHYLNTPGAVAESLKASPNARLYLTEGGGSSPQKLVNKIACAMADGEINCALLTGSEAFDTLARRARAGQNIEWEDKTEGSKRPCPELTGITRESSTKFERVHNLLAPINCYPLYALGLAHQRNQSIDAHRLECSQIYEHYNKIAAQNPLSWFPKKRSVQEINEPTDDNRMVGFPYTKYLNAVIRVNQSASVLMMTKEKALELGVPISKMVFIRGGADLNEVWNLTERRDYHSSPAIHSAAKTALAMASTDMEKIKYLDIYSCFPSAVMVACKELGIDDPISRPLTLTGGLPYFGGAGNNYSMHAIAEMVNALRSDTQQSYGLVNANGWYLTKHSLGVYSNAATADAEAIWNGAEYKRTQLQNQMNIDLMGIPSTANPATGTNGEVVTYTLAYDKAGPKLWIGIIALPSGRRTVVNIDSTDPATLAKIHSETAEKGVDLIGRKCVIGRLPDGRNTASLEGI